jgi:hypothetical protein
MRACCCAITKCTHTVIAPTFHFARTKTAQKVSEPPEIATAVLMPETVCGLDFADDGAAPVPPKPFSPQQLTAPVTKSTQVFFSEAAIAIALALKPETAFGDVPPPPFPDWLPSLSPQHLTAPVLKLRRCG